MNMSRLLCILVFSVCLTFSFLFAQDNVDEDQSVYEYVLTKIEGPRQAAVQKLSAAFTAAGMNTIGVREMGMPDNCDFKSTVLVTYDSLFASSLIKFNGLTAPFGLVDRIVLFEDEDGLNAAIVNPVNILRTIIMDDETHIAEFNAHRLKLRELITSNLQGTKSDKPYGEERDEGYIGRTMGVMAGGPFNEKIESIVDLPDTDFESALAALQSGLKSVGTEYHITLNFVQPVKEYGFAVFGLTGDKLESRSFDIVGSGSNDDRDDFKCPGLAHSPAYPLELVLFRKGNGVSIRMVDAMFRMKMYFEDAGMMAFASNMGMPGSIKDEIVAMVKKTFSVN